MADWSSVALAGVSAGAGVVGGFIGYASARLQAHVGLRQVDAEAERLGQLHEEEHLRNRQTTYHSFLDVEQRFLALASREDDFPRELHDAWLQDYHHTYDGVILFGTAAARIAAEALNGVHHDIHRAYLREQGTSFADRFREAYLHHRGEYRERRLDLLDAMRLDVAPEIRGRAGGEADRLVPG